MFPGSAARLEVLSISLHVLTKCEVLAALQVDSDPACTPSLSYLPKDLRPGSHAGCCGIWQPHTNSQEMHPAASPV